MKGELMIEQNEFNENKLGFGLMRLPKKGLLIDVEHTSRMVDAFLDAGLTYFDTAFVYVGSEDATRKALVSRYPRESFTLATKLFATAVPTEKAAKEEFEVSLRRTGAGYFDYYLLHSLNKKNYKKFEKFHLWDFVREEKEKGRIRHYGFSFHDGPELLDEILTDHPDAEFVQLQINYADWEDSDVQSRANYEVARKHGKPIIIMEPVKGGKLADPPEAVKKLFKEANPDASYASWAIRFAASLDGVLAVLSGMSNIDQMNDNLSYMKNFVPMNEEEFAVIKKAQEIMADVTEIKCTSCRYCTEGCPMNIPIPDIFTARNKQLVSGQIEAGQKYYEEVTVDTGKASECVECGQCEAVCPQHLPIIENLKECSAAFGG